MDYLELSQGDVVVDLGCGSGFTLATAAERAAHLTLIGLDRDPEALQMASALLEKAGAPFELIRADLEASLPLPTGSVTRAVSHNVLEGLTDPSHLVSQACRILRPGGLAAWSHTDFDRERPGSRSVAVGSHRCWQRTMGGRAGASSPGSFLQPRGRPW